MTYAEWVCKHCFDDDLIAFAEATPFDPAEFVATCLRGDWLLDIAEGLGYPPEQLALAARNTWRRAVFKYAPAALEAAGLTLAALAFKYLSPDISAKDAHQIAAKAEKIIGAQVPWRTQYAITDTAVATKAADAITAEGKHARRSAAYVAARATARAAYYACGAAAKATENAKCVDEVRAALPDLASRWSAALEATQ